MMKLLDAIAEKAIERKTGARGLRSIVENIMMEVCMKYLLEMMLKRL